MVVLMLVISDSKRREIALGKVSDRTEGTPGRQAGLDEQIIVLEGKRKK